MTIDVQKAMSAKRDVNIHLCEKSTPLYKSPHVGRWSCPLSAAMADVRTKKEK